MAEMVSGGKLDSLVPNAIDAAQAGELARARQLLQQALAQDPEDEFARLWLERIEARSQQETPSDPPLSRSQSSSPSWSETTGFLRVTRLIPDPLRASLAKGLQPPQPQPQPQSQPQPHPLTFATPRSLALAAAAFLAWVTLAELLTTYTDPRVGLAAHCLLLGALLFASTRTRGRQAWAFLVSLAFAPLIRILSLSLPLTHFPILYWYLITSLPLFAAVWAAGRSLGYSWPSLGLTLRGWPLQFLIGLTGLGFGAAEHYILHPEPLASALDWQEFLPAALILVVCTGLLEEMIFRGLIQRSAGEALGWWGIPYVALLFAVLHLGYESLLDVAFVFVVGLFFGWVVHRTRSLLGVTLAHGLTNVMLFLIMPFVA